MRINVIPSKCIVSIIQATNPRNRNRFQLSLPSIMFVLPRMAWVRNSLFVGVEGGSFSLMKKITGKLY